MHLEIKLPKFHKGQRTIYDERCRFNVASNGRRFGKTKFGGALLACQGGALQGLPCGWFAPNYKYLLDAWNDIRLMFSPVTKRESKSDKRIELITGGVIDFWTLDDPDAGRSRKYARAIIDEAAMVKDLERSWEQSIRPTLSDLKGDAWFFSTPKGFDYFRELFVKGQSKDYPEWKSWQMPTETNPFIDKNEIEAARLELPELVFRQEYLAEFVDFAGTMVKREHIKYGLPDNPISTVIAVDLAISTKQSADYTAAVVLQRDLDGSIYVVDVFRKRESFYNVIQSIIRLAKRHNPNLIAIEQVQYQAAVVQELLRTTNLPVKGFIPEKDKLTRFQPVQARYEQGLIYHANGLVPDFENELLTFPVTDHDDMVDALALAVHALPNAGDYQAHSTGQAREFSSQATINTASGWGSVRS